MSIENILLWVVFGALAGWIAGKLMGNRGGLVGNVILGIVGSFVGGLLARVLGLDVSTGFNLVGLLVAIGGACVVIFLARLLVRK